MSASLPAGPRPRDRHPRTYVVLAWPSAADSGATVSALGTVQAPSRRAAASDALALAAARLVDCTAPGRAPRRDPALWFVRWWTVSACRPSWLYEALARDGVALRTRRRPSRA